MRVFFDTCIWIYFIEDSEQFGDTVKSAISSLGTSDEVICSELVRFECLVGSLKQEDEALHKRYHRAFSQIEFAELRRNVFDKAASIRSETGVKAMDSLHLASAIFGECDEFWTADKRLKSVDDQINIRVIS